MSSELHPSRKCPLREIIRLNAWGIDTKSVEKDFLKQYRDSNREILMEAVKRSFPKGIAINSLHLDRPED